MKRRILYLSAVAVLLVSITLFAADEKPWFDMKNCDFCVHLTKDPHLLDNMCWNHYDISNGVMNVTTVKPEFKESYLKAQKAMEELGDAMMKGKTDVKMCGSCEFYGKLIQMGAKFEMVETDASYILLITSDNPKTIEAIKEYGKRNRDEMAKMKTKEKK